MEIVLIGMNHKTAPLEIRERLSLSPGDEPGALRELMSVPGVREAVFLGTCNRVEVLACLDGEAGAVEGLKSFLYRRGNLERSELERCLYVHEGPEAVRHLLRVASSLDSMVMGEPQILGQVKDAYRAAVAAGTTGAILNRLFHFAFRVAKRVRTETAIAGNAVSVSYAAVELAKKIFGSLKGKGVLLIGAGQMAELAARHLLRQGVGEIAIANRTMSRAEELAVQFQGRAEAFESLPEVLCRADIVIASTGAPGYVVTAAMVAGAMKKRRNRPLFLIDIAVPRDIEPRAGEMENVYLYNIDHLQDVVDANRQSRRLEALKAEEIIAEEVAAFQKWLDGLEVVPTIVSLREKMERIVRGELERSSSWLRNLRQEDRLQVEMLISSVVNKILHDPITGLKEESGENGGLFSVAVIQKLFKL